MEESTDRELPTTRETEKSEATGKTVVELSGTNRQVVDAVDPETKVPIAVVEHIADLESCDPCSLSPVGSAVDPDALDALFDHRNASRSNTAVAFEYEGYRVTVTTLSAHDG
jgi:hypothetical protein